MQIFYLLWIFLCGPFIATRRAGSAINISFRVERLFSQFAKGIFELVEKDKL